MGRRRVIAEKRASRNKSKRESAASTKVIPRVAKGLIVIRKGDIGSTSAHNLVAKSDTGAEKATRGGTIGITPVKATGICIEAISSQVGLRRMMTQRRRTNRTQNAKQAIENWGMAI